MGYGVKSCCDGVSLADDFLEVGDHVGVVLCFYGGGVQYYGEDLSYGCVLGSREGKSMDSNKKNFN